jgi:uroporphyrinogen decarboxylase
MPHVAPPVPISSIHIWTAPCRLFYSCVCNMFQISMNMLTPRERTRRALNREPVDRLPTQINLTPPMAQRVAAHFGVSIAELQGVLGNHLLRLDLGHPARFSDDGKTSLDWWGAGWSTESQGYVHTFAPMRDQTSLGAFPWPDPADRSLLDLAASQMAADNGRHFVVPNLGMCLFERAWSLRGFEAFLMDMGDCPEWVEEILDRITEIQLVLIHRFIAAGVDGGYFGDDYGAQRSLLFSARMWRRFIKPRLARLFAPFREARLPVILHSDGDIRAILPDLVEIGVTTLNPVQPEVLNHEWLYREFGQLSFYGGISTQHVLPHGTADEIRAAVEACARNLAPDGTGLLLGPSHRMQTDIPMENLEIMMRSFPS